MVGKNGELELLEFEIVGVRRLKVELECFGLDERSLGLDISLLKGGPAPSSSN